MLHRIKKHNDINEGKWIGVGGHAEGQESPEECLLREVKEETGLTLTSYKLRGLVTFISDKCEPELMCVFTANEYIGELTECNEGELYWIDKAVVPTLPTWEGDRVFLDLLLSGDERFFSLKLQYEGDSWPSACPPTPIHFPSFMSLCFFITVIIISVPAVSKALIQVKRAALQ